MVDVPLKVALEVAPSSTRNGTAAVIKPIPDDHVFARRLRQVEPPNELTRDREDFHLHSTSLP